MTGLLDHLSNDQQRVGTHPRSGRVVEVDDGPDATVAAPRDVQSSPRRGVVGVAEEGTGEPSLAQ